MTTPVCPSHLFHYTNVETLALILKNRTIRFVPLNKMDDLQEKKASDAKSIGHIFYVSCWTEDTNESIPMWNMYTSLSGGIRIKMKSIPFENKQENIDELKRALQPNPHIKLEIGKDLQKTLIPYSEMITHNFIVLPNDADSILKKVEYTSDKNKLSPRIVSFCNGEMELNMEYIGRVKNTHWEFQREWRYILQIVSHDILDSACLQHEKFKKTMINVLEGKYEQKIPFYDLKISDSAFAQMEITLSPKISLGNRVIVENLIEKYNPSATIHNSSLNGLI